VLFEPTSCAFCYRSVCTLRDHACLAGVTPGSVVAAVEALAAPPPGERADRRRAS